MREQIEARLEKYRGLAASITWNKDLTSRIEELEWVLALMNEGRDPAVTCYTISADQLDTLGVVTIDLEEE